MGGKNSSATSLRSQSRFLFPAGRQESCRRETMRSRAGSKITSGIACRRETKQALVCHRSRYERCQPPLLLRNLIRVTTKRVVIVFLGRSSVLQKQIHDQWRGILLSRIQRYEICIVSAERVDQAIGVACSKPRTLSNKRCRRSPGVR
jgi:hypothetical protein